MAQRRRGVMQHDDLLERLLSGLDVRHASSNGFNTSCGFAGFACNDCTAVGQVCNSISLSCMSGTGGGAGGSEKVY